MLAVCHKKCYNEIKKKVPGIITPAVIGTENLKSIKIFNYVGFTFIILLLVYAVVDLRRVKDWMSFFDFSVFGVIVSLIGLIVTSIFIYIPIRNLKIIRDIENLK